MAWFHFGKKKEEKKAPACCCGGGKEEKVSCCGGTKEEIASVKVLGAGCKTCHQQYEHVQEAVGNLGLSVSVEYITDMEKIMEYGVMTMPAIVINEQVAVAGKVLSVKEAEALLNK